MSVLTILLLATYTLTQAFQLCTESPCDFDFDGPSDERMFVCGCGVIDCNLNINGQNGKDMQVFTYAQNTVINCNNKDSCQAATINAGTPPPINITTSGMGCNGMNVILNCNGEASCKDMNIISSGINVNVNAQILDSFDESILNCYDGAWCSLSCSNELISCDGAICGNNCSCVGRFCPGWTIAPSVSPIPNPTEPADTTTAEPLTMSPVPVVPDYVRCSEIIDGVCEISPLGGDIIVVTNSDNVTTLKIHCSEAEQCKENNGALIVYSAAINTEISCGNGYQSCDGALFYIGELDDSIVPISFNTNDFTGIFNSFEITCAGIDTCKGVNITITGTFINNPVITATGSKSLAEGKVDCQLTTVNQTCTLNCNNHESLESCDQVTCVNDCQLVPVSVVPRIFRNSKRTVSTVVTGSAGGEVILTNTYGECEIDCMGTDMCKKLNEIPFRVYSGCNYTTINCGENSCKNAIINVGQLANNLPATVTASNFTGEKKVFILNCIGYSSCLHSTINVVGEFSGSVIINAPANNALKDATLTCSAEPCIINCNSNEPCDKLTLNCDLVNTCECNGACSNLNPSTNLHGVTVNTYSPTVSTAMPTGRPSFAPTPIPTKAPTSSELIIYKPQQTGVFVCKNNVANCILDCNDDISQCDQFVTLLSAANNTQILCNKKDTCKMLTVYLGESVTQSVLNSTGLRASFLTSDFVNNAAILATVNCSAEAGCYKLNLNVDATFSDKIEIDTGDFKDSLKDAKLTVSLGTEDAICNIYCGMQGCKDANFLGQTSVTCSCTGTSCPSNSLRQSKVHNSNQYHNTASVNEHKYPTFLPTIIIICTVVGLVCLTGFCLYYRCFTNKQIKNENMLSDVFKDYNHGPSKYDTFQSNSLELNNFA